MDQGQTRSGILRAGRVIVLFIYAILMTYVVILSIAFVLRLFGANPTASFVDWIYSATARIMQPFRGMFPNQQVTSKSVFDASLLFAIIIYYLAALLIHAVVDWLSDRIYSIRQRQAEGFQQPPVGSTFAGPGFGAPSYGPVGPQGSSYPSQTSAPIQRS